MWVRLLTGFVLSSAIVSTVGCGDDSSTSTGGSTSASSSGGTGDATSTSSSGAGGESSGGDGGSDPSVSSSGGSDQGGGSAGGSAPVVCDGGPALGRGPDCVACQTENCCINAAGCLADEACLAVEACTLENNSVSQCVDENPDAIWYVSGVVICRQNNCAEECGFEQATCGNIIPSPSSCTDAFQAACCDEATACGENDACVALIYQCLDANECGDAACLDECLAQYPDGVDDFTAMDDCLSSVECP